MRSALYEQVLEREGVDFTYMERLDLKAIDTNAGMNNQARLLEPIKEALIEEYAELYRQGSDGPPIVVWKYKSVSRWVPIDGNQRIAAAKKAGRKTLDAYVVDWLDDRMVLDRIIGTFNNHVNGERLIYEEALEHAVSYTQKYGIDATVSAKTFGVKVWELKRRIANDKMRGILKSRGANEAANKLPEDKLHSLQPLVSLGEDVFTQAASTVQRCGMSTSDIAHLNREVKKAKTAEAKAKVVAEFGESDLAKQRKAETQGGRVPPKQNGLLPCERLYKKFVEIQQMFEDFDKAALRRQGVGAKEMRQVIADVVDKAILTFGLGARPNKEVG